MYYLSYDVYKNIANTIGSSTIESGGIIGIKNNVICEYYFDVSAKCSDSTYLPSIDVLNLVIREWNERNVKFIGIVHSHANSYNVPSKNDIDYAKTILKTNRALTFLILPIVTVDKGNIHIDFYKYSTKLTKINMTIINRDFPKK